MSERRDDQTTLAKHLILVEGYFGAMRLHGLRFPAVALMGSSLSEEQMVLLREHCPVLRFVTLMLDGDEAGQKAGDIIAARLAKHWWTRIVVLPAGTQPDTVKTSVLEQLLGRSQRE
jgi:DNA primase